LNIFPDRFCSEFGEERLRRAHFLPFGRVGGVFLGNSLKNSLFAGNFDRRRVRPPLRRQPDRRPCRSPANHRDRIEDQTRWPMETINTILDHQGLTWTDVVKVTEYLTDMAIRTAWLRC
jgi:endoribonuclease L-PSP